MTACSPKAPATSPVPPASDEPTVTFTGTNFAHCGLYTWDNVPSQYEFWKACGVDTIQLSERLWYFSAADEEQYQKRIASFASYIDRLHEAGFLVDVLFFSNLRQYKGEYEYDKDSGGIGVWFHPDDEEALNEKLYYTRMLMTACAKADYFTIEAGDPGGITDRMGEGDEYDYAKLVEAFNEVAKECAPNVKVRANTWAVSAFKTPNISVHELQWWINENEMTRNLLLKEDFFGEDLGLFIPCHDYYRPKLLKLYNQAVRIKQMEDFPLFPTVEDLQPLTDRDTEIWLWPFNLLGSDGNADYCASFTSSLRYVHRDVNAMRELGADGIMADWTWKGYLGMAINTYGYARFVNDPAATPEKVIDEYASYLTDGEGRAALAQILRFIENKSRYDASLPKTKRLPKLECTVTSAQQALDLLGSVTPKASSDFPLPENVDSIFARIKDRLNTLLDDGR
ncbi:MAG: hypothetical protein IKD06_00415 [Clostridia bacterium]|nr:hypothetical protein [Clostridia bacterium]